jgi:hypothetical protein
MDQPILFHKPNKEVRSEKKINQFISQTKHTLNLYFFLRADTGFSASIKPTMVVSTGHRI